MAQADGRARIERERGLFQLRPEDGSSGRGAVGCDAETRDGIREGGISLVRGRMGFSRTHDDPDAIAAKRVGLVVRLLWCVVVSLLVPG